MFVNSKNNNIIKIRQSYVVSEFKKHKSAYSYLIKKIILRKCRKKIQTLIFDTK